MLLFDIFKNEKMSKFLLKISEEKEKENIVLSQSPESIGKFPHPCQENIIIIIAFFNGGVNETIVFPFLSVF